ncbi:MAG: S-layer homology domain-containing protein [Clostridiales bacterium]|nr:MAG: S-layer homology domain-containing protein [Clostridiales bacterium]
MQMFYNLLLNKNVSGESAFDDVRTDAWYYDAVTALANMGIIKGAGGNRFDPDGEITRAEFIAAAMRFTDIDVKGTVTFTDVAQDHWAVKRKFQAPHLSAGFREMTTALSVPMI